MIKYVYYNGQKRWEVFPYKEGMFYGKATVVTVVSPTVIRHW